MSLALLPEKEFRELLKGISEDSGGKKFSYDEMQQEYSDTYDDILNYMSETNVKFIGTGSSRTAFYMPPGSVAEDRTCPSCFKVAKNRMGVWQNDAEISVFRKYGRKRACFPEMFDYDKSHKYYLLTEVGTPLTRDFDAGKYIADWNRVIDYYGEFPKRYKIPYSSAAEMVRDVVNIATSISYYESKSQQKEDLAKLSKIAKRYKKYAGILDFIAFAVDGGMDDVEFGDFEYNYKNWAIVVRDGEDVLIPIDFGFSHDVAEKYKNNLSKTSSSSKGSFDKGEKRSLKTDAEHNSVATVS